jgi:hypothetical protein
MNTLPIFSFWFMVQNLRRSRREGVSHGVAGKTLRTAFARCACTARRFSLRSPLSVSDAPHWLTVTIYSRSPILKQVKGEYAKL